MTNILPPQAKRVFKGVIFDVYQWEQELFDGTFATFEKLTRAETAIVLGVTEDKQIILIEDEQPDKPMRLQLSAGKTEEGESVEQAARREFLEETGYEIAELKPWYTNYPDQKLIWRVCTFVGTGCKKVAEPTPEAGERINVRLFTFDQFIEAVLSEDLRSVHLRMRILEAKLDLKKMAELMSLILDSDQNNTG